MAPAGSTTGARIGPAARSRESGAGNEAIVVMAGVVVDSQRMHRTKEAWDEFIIPIKEEVKTVLVYLDEIIEPLKGSEPFRGLLKSGCNQLALPLPVI